MLPGFGGHLFSECFIEQRLSIATDLPRHQSTRQSLLDCRRPCASLGPTSTVRTVFERGVEPLVSALGFVVTERQVGDELLSATLSAGGPPVGLVVTGWGQPLGPLWVEAVVEARRRGASWCLLTNGTTLRLIETERLYSRRFAEFDIDTAIDDERTRHVLLLLAHAEAFSAGSGAQPLVRRLLVASDQHASGVCRSLQGGVLEAASHLLAALLARPPRPSLDSSFEQALTVVYRLLFLLFAEARGLTPIWHPVYRESYSIEALRSLVERKRPPVGLWDALRAMSRLAHHGCRAGDLQVTPFNGRLFSPARTPLAERRDLDDEAARRAVLALSTRQAPGRDARERIAYRDLGVEQLGAVYETVLDYEPRLVDEDRQQADVGRPPALPARSRRRVVRVTLEAGSGTRKATGTFYTPQAIAQYLVRRTLGPLVANRTSEEILTIKVLDPAMGSGAFLVAACGYLAQAYEAALVRGGACHPSDLGPREHVSIRRTIAERCLYGVDVNPMAVQLARLSLWLTTLAVNRPLSFLDHHLQAGDSLLGAWLTSLCHPPAVPRRRRVTHRSLALFDEPSLTRALRLALPVRFSLATGPNETLEQVREKERSLAALARRDTELSKWKRVADLWCATWFSDRAVPPGAFRDLSDAVVTGTSALPETTARACLAEAEAIAASRRFFHWELEFPEAFFDEAGSRLADPGFDAVVGNPPWDMLRADDGPASRRHDVQQDRRAVVRFTRDAGIYAAQSPGHANRYQLFVERAVSLARCGGRIGLVLPSGIATDQGSAPLRRLLFSRCAVDAIVGFENRRRLFPIHRSVRFVLLTATSGHPTTETGCRLGELDASLLDAATDDAEAGRAWFPVHVTPTLLERLSGDDLALPDLRSSVDLTIAERMATDFPPLGRANGWNLRFSRELNASDDRDSFRADEHGVPIVEGKDIQPFRAERASVRRTIAPRDADRLLGDRYRRARLAYRDVASATNRMTLIAAILPAGCASTHTLFCLRTRRPLRLQHALAGLFNSFVVNYLIRLRVTTHVTTTIVERLPAPPLDAAPQAYAEIGAIARLLARRKDEAYEALLARLNARVARLYRLSPAEFDHILTTFPLVPQQQREAARRAFQDLGA